MRVPTQPRTENEDKDHDAQKPARVSSWKHFLRAARKALHRYRLEEYRAEHYELRPLLKPRKPAPGFLGSGD